MDNPDDDDNLSAAPTSDANEDADSAHSDVESQLSASVTGVAQFVIASLAGSAQDDFDNTLGKLSGGRPTAKSIVKQEITESDQAASSAEGLVLEERKSDWLEFAAEQDHLENPVHVKAEAAMQGTLDELLRDARASKARDDVRKRTQRQSSEISLPLRRLRCRFPQRSRRISRSAFLWHLSILPTLI